MRNSAAKSAAVAVPAAAAAAMLAILLHAAVGPAGPARPAAAAARPVHAVLNSAWYLGVREPGAPASWAPVSEFTRAAGVRPGIVLYYSGWRRPFALPSAELARRHGAVLLVQMEPWGASLSRVASGGYDGYLRSFAAQVRRFGHQVIIGFGHEMNGPWYPWGYRHVPARLFAAAWRHVVTVFRAAGADNVTWLWTVHNTGRAGLLRSYWPGSRYVTWVGIDGYYEFPDDSFGSIFGRAARAVRAITGKPILISETAVGPGARDAPAKIRGLFAGARRDHFIGLVWFDVDQHDPPYHQDWRLENTPAALAAFRTAAAR